MYINLQFRVTSESLIY